MFDCAEQKTVHDDDQFSMIIYIVKISVCASPTL